MNMQMLSDYVLIKLDAAEEKTKGGIIIPSTAKEEINKGTIIAVGPGKQSLISPGLDPIHLVIGDKVYFEKYSRNEVKIDDEMYCLVHQPEVYCIIKD